MDGRVAARVEEALAIVVPADEEVLVSGLTERLEDLAAASLLAEPMLVDLDDVARLIGEIEAEGYAAWTIRGVLTVLGRVLGSAERRGLIAANPVRRLERGERPYVERREFPSLDVAAIGRLIASTPAKYRTLVAVSVLTGIRQSEALGLGSCSAAPSSPPAQRASRRPFGPGSCLAG